MSDNSIVISYETAQGREALVQILKSSITMLSQTIAMQSQCKRYLDLLDDKISEAVTKHA